MRRPSRWFVIGPLVGLPVVVLGVLLAVHRIDLTVDSARLHLAFASAIALAATTVAAVAIAATVRTRQGGTVFVAVGCLAVGIFMFGHGLATPGILGNAENAWLQRFANLGLIVFVAGLLVAGARPASALHRLASRHPAATVAVPATLMAAFTAFVASDLTRLGGTSPLRHEAGVTYVIAVGVGAGALRAAWVHLRRWQLGHDVVQFALMLAATMTVAAVTALQFGRYPRISWWDYHIYLIAGFGGAVYAVRLRARRARDVAAALDGAFADDPFAHIVRGYPDELRRLVRAVEIKDAYTHGHSARTAELAVEIGLKMGLSPDRLRTVARGGYLHDVGKLAIPDEILNKPGKLTDDERKVIETHPQLGYEIASGAGSLEEALDVILCHHERFDGTGYPRAIAGRAIPLEARVVSVADVWDALTTDRAYRPGWPAERALAHVIAGSGTHFDPLVVDALVEVVADRGVRLGAEPGSADEARHAAETCHELDQHRAESVR